MASTIEGWEEPTVHIRHLAQLATLVAATVVACSGDADEPQPIVGVWPAAVERSFVDETVASGFLDRFSAQCVLEQLQQEMTVEQFEAGLAGGDQDEFGEAYSRALAQCSLIRNRAPGG